MNHLETAEKVSTRSLINDQYKKLVHRTHIVTFQKINSSVRWWNLYPESLNRDAIIQIIGEDVEKGSFLYNNFEHVINLILALKDLGLSLNEIRSQIEMVASTAERKE